MIYLFVSLLFAAVYLLYQNEYQYIRFFSLFLLCGSLGGLADFFAKNVIPHVANSPPTSFVLIIFSNILFTLSHLLSPYFFLLFGINYSHFLKFEAKKIQYLVLLLILPLSTCFSVKLYPSFSVSFMFLAIWGSFYVLGANFLVLYAYLKESSINKHKKNHKLLTFIVIFPPTTFVLVTNYVFPSFGQRNVYLYNSYVVVLFVLIFFIVSIKYGSLGFKFNLQKQSYDKAMKAITSSTSILNHVIKNELCKMEFYLENLTPYENIPLIKETHDSLVSHVNYMYEMVAIIKDKTQDIVLIEEPNNLRSLIEYALNINKILFLNKDIRISELYDADIEMHCHKLHLIEAFNNIFKNSIEAIKCHGTIKVHVFSQKNQIVITIEDNGCGISKYDMNYVFDPFFTTKSGKTNFGLGLSYCNNVINKHDGSIEIQSEENKGTIITIRFPVFKIVYTKGLSNYICNRL